MARKSRKNIVAEAEPISLPIVYNAAAYVRLSSDDTKKRGDSLETQRNIIENFIASGSGIRLVEVYTDNNATGTNFDRPGFQRMMADAESGIINCIIVKDLSRFGRNAIDAGYYIEKYLPALKVRFIAVTDSYDSLDGNGGILLPLKNVINESYALDISRKCRIVQRQNIREGCFVGRLAPYGYRKAPDDCHKLVVNEGTAPVVRRIFEWTAQGVSPFEIARRLIAENIPTPGHRNHVEGFNKSEKLIGNPYWKASTIKTILSSRVYIGDMVQGKTQAASGRQIDIDPAEWICVENTHEPIISRRLFERVQVLLWKVSEKAKTAQKLAPYTPPIFKGKILCAQCGYPMRRHRQNKDGIYWYRCESQINYGKDACVQVSVKEAELEAEILATLCKLSEVIAGRWVSLEREAAALNSLESAAETELQSINLALSDNGRFLKSLYESMISGMITADEFSKMKADYESKIKALSQRADAIRDGRRGAKARASQCRELSGAVSMAIRENCLTTEIVDALIEKILVRPDKSFEVSLRFKNEFGEEALRCG